MNELEIDIQRNCRRDEMSPYPISKREERQERIGEEMQKEINIRKYTEQIARGERITFNENERLLNNRRVNFCAKAGFSFD